MSTVLFSRYVATNDLVTRNEMSKMCYQILCVENQMMPSSMIYSTPGTESNGSISRRACCWATRARASWSCASQQVCSSWATGKTGLLSSRHGRPWHTARLHQGRATRYNCGPFHGSVRSKRAKRCVIEASADIPQASW